MVQSDVFAWRPGLHIALAGVSALFLALAMVYTPSPLHPMLLVLLLGCGAWLMLALQLRAQERETLLWERRRARWPWMKTPEDVSAWAWQVTQDRVPFVLLPAGKGVEGSGPGARWEWFPVVREEEHRVIDSDGKERTDIERHDLFVLCFRLEGQSLNWGVLCPHQRRKPFCLPPIEVSGLRRDMRLYGKDRVKSFVAWNPSSLQRLSELPASKHFVVAAFDDTVCVSVPQAWLDKDGGRLLEKTLDTLFEAFGMYAPEGLRTSLSSLQK